MRQEGAKSGSQSLVRRAVLLVCLAELCCALGLSFAALLHESRTRFRAFDAMLQGRSDSLLGAIQDAEDPDDNVEVDRTELRSPPNDVYAVYNRGGRLLGTSAGAPPELSARAADGFRNASAAGHRYRVLQDEGLRIIDRAENGGVGLRRPVTIVYAASTEGIWREILEAASFYAGVSVVLLFATAALLVLLLKNLLRPLRQLAEEAGGITASSLQFTPPPAALRLRELRPLSEALSAAIERLRRSFEMEQHFIGDAAHELKTAVAVVRSSIQLLSMRGRSEGEYRRGLDRIFADNSRVEELLARMLTLARFGERDERSGEEEDLGVAVRRAVERLESYAEARDVKVRQRSETGVRAPLSRERAETLVSNLVVNAVQHSPRGSVIAVEVEGAVGLGRAVTLRVRDNGAGISAEALPHVFDRFYREDSSRSRETGGAGLGLAICKSIAEAAGGVIAVESKPGVGTTVEVTFSRA